MPLTSSKKNKYAQYFTPRPIAQFMLELADLNDIPQPKILEPSCGQGIFLQLLESLFRKLGKKGWEKVDAFEVDRSLAKGFKGVRYESFVSAKLEVAYDLVIGNPPYIRWKNLERELKKELEGNDLWNRYCNSLCDYLYIFILKSIQVLKEGGQLIFICPEYWMNTTHSLRLRNYMVERGYFENIFHFNETPIFDNASVSVIVFKYVKSKKVSKSPIQVVKYFRNKALTVQILEELKKPNTSNSYIQHLSVKPFEKDKRWLLLPETALEEMERFEQRCCYKGGSVYTTIGDVCEIGNGMVSGLDKAFRLEGEDLDLAPLEERGRLKVIKAKDLRPFSYQKITPYIFVNNIDSEKILEGKCPDFYLRLQPFRERLEKRYQYNRKIPYWHWVFLRNFKLFASQQDRIFVPCKERISNKDFFRFAFVEKGIFPTQDVTALFVKKEVKENIYYILAFLNNWRVFNWLKNKGIVKGSIVEFSEKPVSSIPFRRIDWGDEREVKVYWEIVRWTKKVVENGDKKLIEKINEAFDFLLFNG